MDLEMEIQVLNPKDKNNNPEERDIWKIPELPPVPKGRSRDDIPASVQEQVYGSKETGVGTFSQLVDRKNKLLPSRKEILGSRKDTRTSGRLDTNSLQRKSLKDKIPSMSSKDQRKELDQKKRNTPVEDLKASTRAKQKQASPQGPNIRERERQGERETPNITNVTLRITGFQRRR
ncbi:hypothetical protein O181_078899 [Austropuccinia psidii MF-1]|uniref:Uncharacterized protein n=1 Tax=Austropuccinia psidii MF-1 TaxID=1389203 RepID=A0A9Q3IHQ7_9BASI|nr:hypothetical protein [Austropuccinia psidii MF-1]